jgi:hypothetical protein
VKIKIGDYIINSISKIIFSQVINFFIKKWKENSRLEIFLPFDLLQLKFVPEQLGCYLIPAYGSRSCIIVGFIKVLFIYRVSISYRKI